jgi:hypothetical protein
VKSRSWLLAAVCVFLPCALIGHLYFDSPRRILLQDVRDAESVIVLWNVREDGEITTFGFQLNSDLKWDFEANLGDTLSLNYFQMRAVVKPLIKVLIMDDTGAVLRYYVVRAAEGGRSHIHAIREMAAQGRVVEDLELIEAQMKGLTGTWPHPVGFEYEL